ncbi:enolase [Striga asiatica]|uniref:Enolase n=1 Tax=Striga asiatica TaxID=4170 RepID=A0A5A7QRH4_STRAF|nr:enolase [Striga asiatica]
MFPRPYRTGLGLHLQQSRIETSAEHEEWHGQTAGNQGLALEVLKHRHVKEFDLQVLEVSTGRSLGTLVGGSLAGIERVSRWNALAANGSLGKMPCGSHAASIKGLQQDVRASECC